MRIALVTPYALDVPGGVQTHVRGLARHLARSKGAAVMVLSPGSFSEAERFGDGSVTHTGIGRTTRLPFNGSRAPITLDPRSWGRARALLAAFHPDILHVHEPLAPALSLLVTCGVGGDVPAVATLHMWSSRSTAYRLWAGVFRRRLGRYRQIWSVGADTATFQGAALGMSPKDMREFPNAVDVPEDIPSRLPAQRQRVTYLGRLETRKGVDLLLGELPGLSPAVADRIDEVYVVGDGPLRARAQALAAALPFPVVFTGVLEDAEKWQVLADSDIVVAPARGGEAFGIVIVEAMAAGCLVVCSDIPGYRLVAHDRQNALTFDPTAHGDLRRVLEQAICEPELRPTLVAGGYETARAYSWRRQVDLVYRGYEEVLGRRR